MILGIMQPYFFPYLGYFDLINYCDEWIVFDNVQYIRHGWINRNRILHPKEGWQYFIIPIKKSSRKEIISKIQINSSNNWQKKIFGQLQHYKKYADYYNETIELLEDCLSVSTHSLSELNVACLEKVCSRLSISFNYRYFSEMDLKVGPIENPGDWALQISKAVGAAEYVNPPGGREIFDSLEFKKNGIKLTIREMRPIQYTCNKYNYIPSLSILDVLMWNSPVKIKKYLDQ